jgi:hypothetical protein
LVSLVIDQLDRIPFLRAAVTESYLRDFLARWILAVEVPMSILKDIQKRLGRQTADHPWGVLRAVESCRKRLPNSPDAAGSQSNCSTFETVPELTV